MVNKISSYEEFLNTIKEGTVFVDFYAVWCGPCKMLAPVVEEASETISDVKFCKVDVDEIEQLAEELSITSIPSLMIFKDGKLKDRELGYKSLNQLMMFINKNK